MFKNVAIRRPGRVSSNHKVSGNLVALTDNSLDTYFHSGNINEKSWALLDLLGSYKIKGMGMIHREECCKCKQNNLFPIRFFFPNRS